MMNDFRYAKLVDAVVTVVKHFSTLGLVMFVVWVAAERAEGALKLILDSWGCVLIILVLLLMIYRERTLRYRKVSSMSDRIKNLEKRVDPNRTSSELTSDGKTNPNRD